MKYQNETNRQYRQRVDSSRARANAPEKPKTKSKVVILFSSALCVFVVFLLGVDYVLQPQRFPTRNIDVIGNMANSTSQQVADAVAKVASNNILRVDIAKAAQAAQSLPWVEGATIRRKWPDTIEVQVNERRILSYWNDSEYLDQLGTIVSGLDLDDPSLPHLNGPDSAADEVLAAYRSWNKVVGNVDLEITSVQLTDRGSWEVSVSPLHSSAEVSDVDGQANSIRVIIGSENMPNRSKRFLKLYTELFQAVHEKVAVIDMRYPDGVSVTWKGAPPQMQGSTTIANT